MKYTYNEIKERPIKELPNNPKPYIYYYLDKGWQDEKNYHLYFYYENGTYDILDCEEGINELSKEDYLNNMRKSLSEIVLYSLFEEILDKNLTNLDFDNNKEIDYYYAVKILLERRSINEDEKIFIKEFYIKELETQLDIAKNSFEPYRISFSNGTIRKDELEKYNKMKDIVLDIKSKIESIKEAFKYKDFNKDLTNINEKQEDLLLELKKLKEEA